MTNEELLRCATTATYSALRALAAGVVHNVLQHSDSQIALHIDTLFVPLAERTTALLEHLFVSNQRQWPELDHAVALFHRYMQLLGEGRRGGDFWICEEVRRQNLNLDVTPNLMTSFHVTLTLCYFHTLAVHGGPHALYLDPLRPHRSPPLSPDKMIMKLTGLHSGGELRRAHMSLLNLPGFCAFTRSEDEARALRKLVYDRTQSGMIFFRGLYRHAKRQLSLKGRASPELVSHPTWFTDEPAATSPDCRQLFSSKPPQSSLSSVTYRVDLHTCYEQRESQLFHAELDHLIREECRL